MTRVVVAGAAGRMGSLAVSTLSRADGIELAGTLVRGSDASAIFEMCRPDVLVDFTIAESSRDLAPMAAERGISPIVGVSGLLPEDVEHLREACEHGRVGGLLVPNFSVGAVLQMRLAAEVAAHLPCDGIREIHHPGKKDSPSGTALATAHRLKELTGRDVPIQSARQDGVVAEQDVRFVQPGESMVISHRVTDRRAYMPGLLLAVRAVRGLRQLVVGLDGLLA
ncbi:MAG: 4-hydroxy-tetrahydrodipicolinate reductase [Planctomycetota bacterium]